MKTFLPRAWWGVAAGTLLLALGFLLLGPTGRDDVYKTLWPAKTFGETGRILNYNGDPIEQSSSLLHVVMVGAMFRLTGWGLPDLNFCYVLACGLLCMALATKLARNIGLQVAPWAGILLGGQAVFVYWALGGLDAVLAALAVLALVHVMGQAQASARVGKRLGRATAMVLAAGMVVTARPEGAFVAGLGLALAASLATWRKAEAWRWELRRLGGALALVALLATAVGCWRLWHSGQVVPQPVVAKAGGLGLGKLLDGLRYLAWETYRHPELLALWMGMATGTVALVRGHLRSLPYRLAWAMAVAAIGFVVASGGDWMENGRFLVPIIPLMVLVTLVEVEALTPRWRQGLLWAWLAASLAGLAMTARLHSTGYSPLLHSKDSLQGTAASFSFTERYNRVHLRDVAPLQALRQVVAARYAQAGKPVTVLSQQAGMLPYHLACTHFGQFRFMDLVGLCTADFTDCTVTQGRGNYRGGLNMDLVYFFDDLDRLRAECGIQAPDIVFGLDDQDGTLRKHVMAQGYRLVDVQAGLMPMNHPLLPGLEIERDEFVAERDMDAGK